MGADDYITKPFDMKLLEQRILSIVRNREVVKNRILKFSGKAIESYEPILTNEQNDQFVKGQLRLYRKIWIIVNLVKMILPKKCL